MNASLNDLYGGGAPSGGLAKDITIQPFATSSILQHHYLATGADFNNPSKLNDNGTVSSKMVAESGTSEIGGQRSEDNAISSSNKSTTNVSSKSASQVSFQDYILALAKYIISFCFQNPPLLYTNAFAMPTTPL